MKLNEWVDDNGNKITLSNAISSSSKGSSGNSSAPAAMANKEKLAELFKYIKNNKTPYTTNIEIVRQQDNYFRFVITRKPIGVKEHDIEFTIRHYTDDSWGLEVWRITDNFINDIVWANKGNGWESLLKALNINRLKDYINVPTSGTPIYSKLTEWLDSKGNKINIGSSQSATKANKPTSYKEKFEKLLDYHIKHSPATVKKTEIVKITDTTFSCKIYEEKSGSWNIGIITAINKETEQWVFNVWTDDNKLIADEEGSGWEDLVRALGFYLNTPNANTKEYEDLVTFKECLDNESRKTNFDSSFAEDFKLYENLWN